MAFGVTDLKKGVVFQLNGTPYRVVEYSQKVVGRGGSIVNVKINVEYLGAAYVITDEMGRAVLSGKIANPDFEINASSLNAGIYFFMIQEIRKGRFKIVKMD